jgi:hypothetical protein
MIALVLFLDEKNQKSKKNILFAAFTQLLSTANGFFSKIASKAM